MNRQHAWQKTVSVVFLVVAAVIYLLPLYWMITGSFKIQSDAMKMPPELFPKNPTLANYRELIWGGMPTLRWLANSFIVAAGITLGSVLTSAMAGYGFAKKRFPGSNALFWILLLTMTTPMQIRLVPLFVMVRKLNLANTYTGAIFPYVAFPFGVFLTRQFAYTIPNDLLAAAEVDGASEIATFTKVVLPLLKPALAAVGIFAFVQGWNQYMWQLVVLTRTEMLTLPVGVAKLVTSASGYNLGLAMAGATFAFLPMLLMFIFFQKYFVQGITMGALKG
ncbi:MAG: carbohydrate ABC transporter permease [Firmicutes bacterium]|nr:carbohydrate ABC transporter permease [Bacillota bacterium]